MIRRPPIEREQDEIAPGAIPALELDLVSRTFGRVSRGASGGVFALIDVSLRVGRGEIVAVIGPSGAGKTTLANIALGLDEPTSGVLRWNGQDVASMDRQKRRAVKQGNRLITQDPFGALHPGMTIAEIVNEPLRGSTLDRFSRKREVAEALVMVGLDPTVFGHRFGHQLSGGQRQRVAIARATVGSPNLIVADEPTSMLDVSVRAGISTLLRVVSSQRSVGVLLITHDLGIARFLANRIVVLGSGRVVEHGSVEEVFARPQAELTQRLIEAAR